MRSRYAVIEPTNDDNLSAFVTETRMYPRRRTAVHIRSSAGGRIDAFSEELHQVRSSAIRSCGYLLEQFRSDWVIYSISIK